MASDGCSECGYNFEWNRTKLVARCDGFPVVLKNMLAADADCVRRRPAAEVWAPIEYAAHVGEAVGWYAGRIRRVLDEDHPQLESFDFDAAAEKGEYLHRSVSEVVADVRTAYREVADIARTVSGNQSCLGQQAG